MLLALLLPGLCDLNRNLKEKCCSLEKQTPEVLSQHGAQLDLYSAGEEENICKEEKGITKKT